jgi:hypothetical protein
VTISDTVLDLEAARTAAGKAVERLGVASNAIEHASAVDRGILENSHRKLQEEDPYILIRGSTLYGPVIPDARPPQAVVSVSHAGSDETPQFRYDDFPPARVPYEM